MKTTKKRVFHKSFRGVSKPTIVLDTAVEFLSKTTTAGSYIISHFQNQARQRNETYSWVGFVNSCKTKVNCKKQFAVVSKQSQYITTSACSCCNPFCETHSWYSNSYSWLAVVVFVCVKLCMYRQWVHWEYGQGRHITEQFAVEFLTAKQARYRVKQFAAVEFIIATQFHPSTIRFTVLATAKHAWYSSSWLAVVVFACVNLSMYG